jgi:hypothetical protein
MMFTQIYIRRYKNHSHHSCYNTGLGFILKINILITVFLDYFTLKFKTVYCEGQYVFKTFLTN